MHLGAQTIYNKEFPLSTHIVLQVVAIKICTSLHTFEHKSRVFIVDFEKVDASGETFLSFNENENDTLRLNDFLDFINIMFTVIFIIYFILLYFQSS